MARKKSKNTTPAAVAPDEAPDEAPTVATYCLKGSLSFYEGGHTRRVYPKGTRVSDVSDECLQWLRKNDPEGGIYIGQVDLPDDEAAASIEAIEQAKANVANATERSTEAAAAVVAATDPDSMATAATHNDAMSADLQRCKRVLALLTPEV